MTLLSLAAINYESAEDALVKSQERINFAAVKLITPTEPERLSAAVTWEQCPPLRLRGPGIDDYSHYCIYDLWRHVDTDYCLVIQGDGYVINPGMWSNEFLQYDYIGAPWPKSSTAYIDPFGQQQRVGNGGFSLRSRKLLTVPLRTNIPWDVNADDFYAHQDAGLLHEDGNICVHNKHLYESDGCQFAPVGVAVHFSQELPVPEALGVTPFGFHRYLPNSAQKSQVTGVRGLLKRFGKHRELD